MAELIPTKEAARRLRRSLSTISRWVDIGKLEPVIKGTPPRGPMWFDAEVIDAMRALEDAKYEEVG